MKFALISVQRNEFSQNPRFFAENRKCRPLTPLPVVRTFLPPSPCPSGRGLMARFSEGLESALANQGIPAGCLFLERLQGAILLSVILFQKTFSQDAGVCRRLLFLLTDTVIQLSTLLWVSGNGSSERCMSCHGVMAHAFTVQDLLDSQMGRLGNSDGLCLHTNRFLVLRLPGK